MLLYFHLISKISDTKKIEIIIQIDNNNIKDRNNHAINKAIKYVQVFQKLFFW